MTLRSEFVSALNKARATNQNNEVVQLVEDCLVASHKKRETKNGSNY